MNTGKLTIIGGPMFAGKTTQLIKRATLLPQNGYIVVKPAIDDRYSATDVVSHNGLTIKAFPIDGKFPRLGEKISSSITTLFIDELNFFTFKHLKFEIDTILSRGIDVIGSGLLYDFLKHPFGATLPLAKIADEFMELTAICDGCKKEANHSYRKVSTPGQVLVGASESYGACCESCWEDLSFTSPL